VQYVKCKRSLSLAVEVDMRNFMAIKEICSLSQKRE
jgi:hypothetical protein